MGITLSNEVKQLVDHPNFAHLATLMSDGSPHSAPVWIGREDDLLLVRTEAGSLKGKNTLRDPRVSISMVDFVDPYSEVQIRGRVVERRPDPELKYYDKMSTFESSRTENPADSAALANRWSPQMKLLLDGRCSHQIKDAASCKLSAARRKCLSNNCVAKSRT